MKTYRNWINLTPLLLAGCLGGGAAAWAPIACSCVEPWMEIAGALNRDLTSPDQLTAQVIADGFAAKYSGKPISAENIVTANDRLCTDAPGQVHCTWWVWEMDGAKKGFSVFASKSQAGIFQSVTVRSVMAGDV